MALPTKGTMRPLKKVLGAVIMIAGLALIISPDKSAAVLCDYKLAFGATIAIAGYFLAYSGRQA